MQRTVEGEPLMNILVRAQRAYNAEHGGFLTAGLGRWEAVKFNDGAQQELELRRAKRFDSQRAEALDRALMDAVERP